MDAGFDWASKHNLVRTSPIHGEEEAKLVLGDSFQMKEEEGEETNQTGSMTCEDSRLNCMMI